MKAQFINKSGWPARVADQLSFRYYFTLDGGTTAAQISVNTNFSECGTNSASGPFLFDSNIYYVEISCAGTKIYPGGQSHYRKEVQFRLTSRGSWDASNDWSFSELPTNPGATPIKVAHLALYDNGVFVWGELPDGATPAPTATPTLGPSTPGPSTTPGATMTPTPENTPVPTAPPIEGAAERVYLPIVNVQ